LAFCLVWAMELGSRDDGNADASEPTRPRYFTIRRPQPGDTDFDPDPGLPCTGHACEKIVNRSAAGATIFAAVACSGMLVFFVVALLLQKISEECSSFPDGCN
jgi:hypothetical protein